MNRGHYKPQCPSHSLINPFDLVLLLVLFQCLQQGYAAVVQVSLLRNILPALCLSVLRLRSSSTASANISGSDSCISSQLRELRKGQATQALRESVRSG